MVTIHSIEEMLNYYISLGGLRKDAVNGFRYVFPRQHSKVVCAAVLFQRRVYCSR